MSLKELFNKRKTALRRFKVYYKSFHHDNDSIVENHEEIRMLMNEIKNLNQQLACDETDEYYLDDVVEEFTDQCCQLEKYFKKNLAPIAVERIQPKTIETKQAKPLPPVIQDTGGHLAWRSKIGRIPEQIALIERLKNDLPKMFDQIETYIINADYPVAQKIVDFTDMSGGLGPVILNMAQKTNPKTLKDTLQYMKDKYREFENHPLTKKISQIKNFNSDNLSHWSTVFTIINEIKQIDCPFLRVFMTRTLAIKLPYRLRAGVDTDNIRSLIVSLKKMKSQSQSEAEIEELESTFLRLIENGKYCPICYMINRNGIQMKIHPILACREFNSNINLLRDLLSQWKLREFLPLTNNNQQIKPDSFSPNLQVDQKKTLDSFKKPESVFDWTKKNDALTNAVGESANTEKPFYIHVILDSERTEMMEARVAMKFLESHIVEDKLRAIGLNYSPLQTTVSVANRPFIRIGTIRLKVLIGLICQSVTFDVVRYKPGFSSDNNYPPVILSPSILFMFSILNNDARGLHQIIEKISLLHSFEVKEVVKIKDANNEILDMVVQPYNPNNDSIQTLIDEEILRDFEKHPPMQSLPIFVKFLDSNNENLYYLKPCPKIFVKEDFSRNQNEMVFHLFAKNCSVSTKLFKKPGTDFYILSPQ